MIPNYQEIMLPLLRLVNEKGMVTSRDAVNYLASHFNLSNEERKKLLPSGKQALFGNRVGWAKFYLSKANLLTTPKRGTYEITERGKGVAKNSKLAKIDGDFLSQYPEYVKFITNNSTSAITLDSNNSKQTSKSELSPQEQLESSYNQLRHELSLELLDKVLLQSSDFFELLVIRLLVGMGYGGSIADAGQAIGRTGDEGIDGTIKEDRLGLDIIYVQAKRWARQNTVGRPDIQRFVGALAGQGARKGIFITTSKFSREAKEYLPKNDVKIVLIDGEELANLMIDYNIGVSSTQIYEVKDIDNDFFEED